MKNQKKHFTLIAGIFVFLLVISFASCGKSDNQTSDKNDNKESSEVKNINNEKAVVHIPSVQCNMCKKNITIALKKIDGVNEIDINVDGKVANIMYDKNKTNVSSIENAITGAGYQANDKIADPTAYEKLDDCCKVPDGK